MQIPDLIRCREAVDSPLAGSLLEGLAYLGEPLLRFRATNRQYQVLCHDGLEDVVPFFQRAIRNLGIQVVISDRDRERIPKEGPVITVSNHPFGGLDGIVLGSILEQIRPDAKLLVNFLLGQIHGIQPHIVQVDPFGGPSSARSNLRGMREALRHLQSGGLLATWPSGTVSHLDLKRGKVVDPVWADNIAQLARKTGATVVPIFFPGGNSRLFQALGTIHPALRTLLLPREMLRMKGSSVEVRVGKPVGKGMMEHFESSREVTDFLRLRTEVLKNRDTAEKISFKKKGFLRRERVGVPIAQTQDKAKLIQELRDLPTDQQLVEQGDWAVYYARAGQIPRLLMEIGRSREITFRTVGEGTGESTDLDRFDSDYIHLFLWNHENGELAGAYRLGLSDEILAKTGKSGLYTTTLFKFKPGVLAEITPGIELGRSFIMEKYQRKLQPLHLLWRGIGTFIARNPKYRILFGPVSISQEYAALSKDMMVTYLKEHTLHPELSSLVKAKRPPRSKHFGSLDRNSFVRSIRSIEDVSALISEVEQGDLGVPVLLRQYLKFNATMLSFNVDPEFNNCIDGLVLVDLLSADKKVLGKYLGKEGLGEFLAYHQGSLKNPASFVEAG